VFVFGLLFGSFANVVIWRFPRGENLSHPGSHCPVCDTPIAWYDNVPVVSWLVLRRRCRRCGTAIPWRYPAVELLSALLWVLAAYLFGPTVQTAAAIFFFYMLLILSFIDLDLRRLPNGLVGLLFGVGVVGVLISQLTSVAVLPLLNGGDGVLGQPVVAASLGALTAAGVTLGIALVYERVRGQQGSGMGDVKLLAAIGLYLGLYALLALFLANVIGAVWGIVAARSKDASLREVSVPFGPFLAIASVVVAAFGAGAWSWYLGLLG